MGNLSATAIRVISGIVLIVAFVLVISLTVKSCDKRRSEAAQSRVDTAQGNAFTNSASDAVNTQANVSANEAASSDLTRSNEEDIRNAQGSGDKVNPAARDAGLRSLCKRAAYRDTARCRMLQPHS